MGNSDNKLFFDKVAYIVPSDDIQSDVEKALHKEIKEGWINVLQISPYDIQGEYDRLVSEGYGCVIARGGTYKELSSVAKTIPVVEERIRTADILQIVTDFFEECEDGASFLYVMIHMGVARSSDNLEKLLPDKVRFIRYDTMDELRSILESIPAGANVCTSGIAGMLTERNDLNLIKLQSLNETLQVTASSARTLMEHMEKNATSLNVINSVYNNIDEGLIIFREDDTITESNAQAQSLLEMKRDELIGVNIHEIIKELPARKRDGRCSIDSPTTFVIRRGSRTLSATVYPFEFFKDTYRYMLILQDVTRIQEAERKIRVRLSKKGLVAEYNFDDILTVNDKMKHTIATAERIAAFDGSVLIYGESGTGKELFAQSIHNASNRSSGPFVAINCGALTDSLLESELFGYEGGSFTGAKKEGKPGLFELAHNGTIFLDEVNSTSMNLQTKILRVIEEKEVMRVGSDYVIPLDIRVISASNSSLPKDVEEGRFRSDLFFRLNTFHLELPPLRERRDDIVPLFKHYLGETGQINADIPSEFEELLRQHSWLGNVRELKSVAMRYYAFGGDNSEGDILTLTDKRDKESYNEVAFAGHASAPEQSAGIDISESDEVIPLSKLSSVVEQLVIESLEGRGFTRSQIADKLGISRQGLYKKLNRKQ